MIHTVIFDIGNVLMKFAWKPYIRELFDEETARIVTKAIWKMGYWNEFDRGVLSEEEVRKAMVSCKPEYEKEIYMALDHVDRCMHKYDYALPWVKELKDKGYQVLFLSNYSKFLQDAKPEVLEFLPYMDGGVFSCDVHIIKPDPAIYEKICEKYDLKPEECLFIDDNGDNVKAAQNFGMHSIRFQEYETSYKEIMEYHSENGK